MLGMFFLRHSVYIATHNMGMHQTAKFATSHRAHEFISYSNQMKESYSSTPVRSMRVKRRALTVELDAL